MADEVVEMLREAAREALPPMEGELQAGGLSGPVEVRRDRWGVPHISASNLHDLFFAQGFVVASDRYFQIELLMRYSSGRLSELIGALTLPLDRFVRTLGWPGMAARHVTGWDAFEPALSLAEQSDLGDLWQCASQMPREWYQEDRAALSRLTPRERMVFELKHYHGLKLRTVGEMLNTTEETAKNTLFRATQKLRSALSEMR